jgi:hypothetical protein
MNPTPPPNPDPWAKWDYTGSSDDDKFPNRFTEQPITDNPTTTKPAEEKKDESGR